METKHDKIALWCENELGYGILLGIEKQPLTKNIFFSTERIHLFDKDEKKIGAVGVRKNPQPFDFFDWSTWKRFSPVSNETLIGAIERLHKEGDGEVTFAVMFHCENIALLEFGAIGFYRAHVYEL